jgi:hypothetical protein
MERRDTRMGAPWSHVPFDLGIDEAMPSNCRFMGSPDAKNGAHWDHEPYVVQALACLGISPQPKGWTTNPRVMESQEA